MSKKQDRFLKIPKSASAAISAVLSLFLLFALIFLSISLPFILDFYLEIMSKDYFSSFDRHASLFLLYLALIPAYTADISILLLLKNVYTKTIFSDSSVFHLRLISWCCIAEAILFSLLAFFFPLSAAVAFAALFLGIVLRVVKNVIAEATEIKNENDYTV